MTWGAPGWWLGLLGVAVLAVVVVLAGRRHHRKLAARFSGEMLGRVLPSAVRLRRAVRAALVLGGLALLVVALAEPLYGKEVHEIEKSGVDIVIAVDLSRSMDARDVDPSRLERARREILDLMEMLQADRVGLVIYAGGAYPRMPLTTDTDALRMLVEEMSTDDFQAQGSELGEAIRMATRLLDPQGARQAGKAILVLSDGEVHDPADAVAAAGEAAEQQVRIFAMGIGEEQAPIPVEGGGWLTHEGKTVLTSPTDRVLKDVARITGGAYVQSVVSDSDMRRLYQEEMRGKLEAAGYGTVQQEIWKSGFQWPLGVGLLALLGAAWLGDGRRRWGAAVAVLLAISGPARAGSLAEGDALYRSGRYAEAEEVFTELSLERPTDPGVFGRLGAARYRTGDYEGAARAWDTQSRLSGEDPDALFNSGNAHHRAGRLEEALERYQHVLDLEPGHRGARRNEGVLLEELAARRAVRPPPPPSGSSDESEQEPSGDQEQEEGRPGQPRAQGAEEGLFEDEQVPGQSQEGAEGSPEAEAQGEQEGSPGAADSSDAQSEAEGSTDEAGDDGQERGDDSDRGVADLEDLDEQGEGADGEPFSGSWEEDGPVSPAQAERLLEGVEEGRPRIRVPGHTGGKPW